MDETIVAVSSGTGRAGRMILRISGSRAWAIAGELGVGIADRKGCAARCLILVAGMKCPVWVYGFTGPGSYTGEDLVEIHVPGNPLLARIILERMVWLGGRLAEAGEFTARAYFNGKIDLAQAEGVAAAIGAQNQRQLAAARQLMAGELAHRLRPMMEVLGESLALVEAGIDFSEEGIQFIFPEEAARRIDGILGQLQTLVGQSARFEKLSHEPTVVLAGRPNAGKSTLLNALAGRGRSVVSSVAGTTRDALSVEIVLERGVVRLIDVAGLDDGVSEGEIESQMREMAHRAIEQSDVVVLVRDSTDGRPEVILSRAADLRVLTKGDLCGEVLHDSGTLLISAATGLGMEGLRAALDGLAFGSETPEAGLALTSRHLNAVGEAIAALERSRGHVRGGAELLAAELRAGLDALGDVLGVVTPDDILGKVFSRFCIGK